MFSSDWKDQKYPLMNEESKQHFLCNKLYSDSLYHNPTFVCDEGRLEEVNKDRINITPDKVNELAQA